MTSLATIIIAAGNSSRLGHSKQLIIRDNENLLQSIINKAEQIDSDVYCILGYQSEQILNQINTKKTRFIVNKNWQIGMGSSIACGMKQIGKHIESVLILLCDQWALSTTDIHTLYKQWRHNRDKIVASYYQEKKSEQPTLGAPAIFPRIYFPQLAELTSTGARKLLIKNQHKLIKVNLPNAGFDLDTTEDLALLRSIYKN